MGLADWYRRRPAIGKIRLVELETAGERRHLLVCEERGDPERARVEASEILEHLSPLLHGSERSAFLTLPRGVRFTVERVDGAHGGHG